MSENVADMVRDDRPIDSVFWGDGDKCFVVGHESVSKIVAYYENGQMAGVPWFAIYVGDVLVARKCAHGCSVHYHISQRPQTAERPAPIGDEG